MVDPEYDPMITRWLIVACVLVSLLWILFDCQKTAS